MTMDEKELAGSAHAEALTNLCLARDMVGNTQYNKWKWALIMAMVEAVVKSLWAIYFRMGAQEE